MDIPLCRHNDGCPAVARFSMTEGCVCFPADREQNLCAQHIVKWGVLGEVKVLEIYHPELATVLGISLEGE